jgi:predicted DNA-binding protein
MQRLTVELSEEAYQLLDDLAKKTHKAKADILREGLGLRQYAQQLEEKNMKLAAVTEDGAVDTKILLA